MVAESLAAPALHIAGLEMRETVREMFTHAYDGYMTHAFPHDELKPLSLWIGRPRSRWPRPLGSSR